MKFLPIFANEYFLIAFIRLCQWFLLWAVNAPEILRLIRHNHPVPPTLHLLTHRCIIQMPAREQILAPWDIILRRNEQTVHGLDLLTCSFRLHAVRIHTLSGSQACSTRPNVRSPSHQTPLRGRLAQPMTPTAPTVSSANRCRRSATSSLLTTSVS